MDKEAEDVLDIDSDEIPDEETLEVHLPSDPSELLGSGTAGRYLRLVKSSKRKPRKYKPHAFQKHLAPSTAFHQLHAFSYHWGHKLGYANPPRSLIQLVLIKL